jgi:hypothetical protein
MKLEVEASLLRYKLDQMMKSKEAMTVNTLEAKLVIAEKKRDVKLAKVEATREETSRNTELEEMKINVKKAKAMKELLEEERGIMMTSTKDMNEH